MIVRMLDGDHWLTRQPDHARHSAAIAASLHPRFLGSFEEQLELLPAVGAHDDGWIPWELSPPALPDGLPVNFTDIARDDHLENWHRSIFGALHHRRAAAAAIVARHAANFLDLHDESTQAAHAELMRMLAARAWPQLDDATRDLRLERAFRALFFGDALSLIPLAGWTTRIALTLIDEQGRDHEFHAWADGPWTVRVDPWPFADKALRRVAVPSVRVPAGQERHALAILHQPRDLRRRIEVDYLHTEEAA